VWVGKKDTSEGDGRTNKERSKPGGCGEKKTVHERGGTSKKPTGPSVGEKKGTQGTERRKQPGIKTRKGTKPRRTINHKGGDGFLDKEERKNPKESKKKGRTK